MGPAADAPLSVSALGPVAVGFRVSLPNGRLGWIQEIRRSDGRVVLVVASGSTRRPVVQIDVNDVEAVWPCARGIVVARMSDATTADPSRVVAAGGIVRMPAREASHLAAPPEDAA